MRAIYAERFSALVAAAQEKLSGLLEISNIEAGLQTVGWLSGNADGESVARAAADHGIEVTPLTRYHRGPASREGLHLGFAAVNGHEIWRGVMELAPVLRRAMNRRA